MKKFVSVMAAAVLAFSAIMPFSASVLAAAPEDDMYALTPQQDILDMIPDVEPSGSVIYGSTTDLNADYMSGWTNNATNNDIKTLIYSGYDTIDFTADETFIVNPIAVKSWSTEEHEDGSKTYTFEIYDNLVYNDGTAITAKDYLFGAMLSSSPEFKELDAVSTGMSTLVGYDEYNAGDTEVFAGMHLLGEYEFSATIKAEEIPNFYEIVEVAMGPSPMHVLAPGVELFESEEGGVELSDDFTVELLQETILNPETGYRYNPKVTHGPYQFDYYNADSKEASVVVNPLYLGSSDGTKPQIERITIKLVTQATMMDELATGQTDMLAGVAGGAEIETGLDLVDEGVAAYSEYPRAGYGKIQFHCDFGPSQFESVRQAIAWCLDRDEFAREFTLGYGIVVNGRYGASQWEYLENRDLLEEKLINYTYNLERAEEILVADGWIYDANGGEYVPGEGLVRHKEVDGEYMPLVIEWLGSENNAVTQLITTMLPSETAKIGLQINLTEVDFGTLTMHLNRNGIDEPVYHMYNLATGFATINQVWYYYSKDERYWGGNYNSNYIADDELDRIVLDMKATEPTDLEGWSEKWMNFQVRWNEILCDIPLYSNLYHDFYNPKIENYTPSPLWSFRYAIQRANVVE
jgi:peptide/nickel transport system substrate-binding protein